MKKTKAQLEKENKELKEALNKMNDVKSIAEDLIKEKNFHNVSDSTFTMKTEIVWDKATVDVMGKVAQGLLNMTELFKNQKIELPSMLNISGVKGMTISGCVLNSNSDAEYAVKMNHESDQHEED